ncbi:MAG: cache domain-containing protein [Chloroflexota bacterium]
MTTPMQSARMQSTSAPDPNHDSNDQSGMHPDTTRQEVRIASGASMHVGRITSIRTWMLLLLVAFTLIPAMIAGGISAILGRRDGLQRAQETLNAVAILKEAQVRTWGQNLQQALNAEILRNSDNLRLTTLLRYEPGTAIFTTVYGVQLSAFENLIASNSVFDEFLLLDSDGVIRLSTRANQENLSMQTREFFRRGSLGPYISSPQFDVGLGYSVVVVAQPIIDDQGETLGVLAARASLKELNQIMQEHTGLGETGETYLVSRNLTLLTQTRRTTLAIDQYTMRTEATQQGAAERQSGAGRYLNYQGEAVIGSYRYIPELQMALIAEQTEAEALSGVRSTTSAMVSATLGAVLLALVVALFASQNLTAPLVQLTDTARRIAAGDLSLQAPTLRNDETGALAAAFNAMTERLRALIESLEQRVSERTQQLQTRSEQLQTASEVGRSVTTILDTNQLIQQVVDLIQVRFELYYVGLFLVDETRQWALLRAGTGRAGQTMLERGHRIRLGEGMIGWSIANAQARIALQAGEDPVRLATPDLPDTRSEAAIPLRSRGQVLGAISIQSTQEQAFDEESITVFQTMADQVAAALDNARLFGEVQQALQTAQEAFGQLSRQAWLERLHQRPVSYHKERTSSGVSAVRDPSQMRSAEETRPGAPLQLPIQVRGQRIGYLRAQKSISVSAPAGEASTSTVWQAQEVGLLRGVVDQLGVMLESARLFEETQLQAERERLVGEITARMRATLDLDNVLQTAAREMQAALNLAEVEIRMGPFDQDGAKAGGQDSEQIEQTVE